MGGLLCGLSQWRTLRTPARQSNLWLHQSVAGWTSALALSMLLVPDRETGLSAPGLMFAAVWLAVGWIALVVISVAVLIALGDRRQSETRENRLNW